jgi:voltage-gated potassium channel Kch
MKPLLQRWTFFVFGLSRIARGQGFSLRPSSALCRSLSQKLLPVDLAELQEETELYDAAFCVIDYDNIDEPYISPLNSESTFIEFTEDGICVPAGPVGKLKENIANALAEPFVELAIAGSVLLNSLLVALSTLGALDPYMNWIRGGELLVSLLFGLDFIGRWFSSSKDTGKHVLDAQFALDVVVVILPLVVGLTPAVVWEDTPLPKAITSPSGLINLELLRVLRLQRVLKDLSTFERFAERALLGSTEREPVTTLVQEWQLQLARVLLSLFTLVSVSSGLVYTAENGVNPAINNYFDALYFGLTTLTTVGFGDIIPITVAGKLVVCGSILVGVAVVPAQAAALVEALLEREELKRRSKMRPQASSGPSRPSVALSMDTGKACPSCGANFHWVSARYCYSCGEELD